MPARPSAGSPGERPAPGRCRAAAAVRPTARGPSRAGGPSLRPTAPPPSGSLRPAREDRTGWTPARSRGCRRRRCRRSTSGNGFDFWNTIPTRRRRSTTSVAGTVDVLAIDLDAPLQAGARNRVVHPVERAEQRALAAAGRPDERGDQARRDVEGHVEQRLLLAVEEVRPADADLRDRAARVFVTVARRVRRPDRDGPGAPASVAKSACHRRRIARHPLPVRFRRG